MCNWDKNLHSYRNTLLKLRVICDPKGDYNFNTAVKMFDQDK